MSGGSGRCGRRAPVDLSGDESGTRRPGFERLLHALCNGRVGATFSIEASRLARNGREWHTLLEFCSGVGALLIEAKTGGRAEAGPPTEAGPSRGLGDVDPGSSRGLH